MVSNGYFLPDAWTTEFEARQIPGCQHPYEEFVGEIEISPNDQNQYQLLRLSNNMVVVCVQDTDAKQASASVIVNIGASSDPPEILGLAHFLEHMLLKGSKKYPEENDYKKYVYGNAGSCNASTYPYCTKYFFTVDNSALEGGLDRLSRFFIDPLMDPDCVDRELNAVDSEFRSKLQDDGKRSFVIFKSASSQSHSFSKFSTGNNKTLRESTLSRGLDIRQEMLDFYKRFYSADLMKLIIVGNHSLDQMTEWAVSMFSDVQSKGDTKIIEPSHPFGREQLGKVLCYEPVGEKNTILLAFALPETKQFYKVNPYRYVSSLLSRADKGSLLSYLQKQGLATSVSAYVYDWSYDRFNVFKVFVSATPSGIKRRNEVVQAVFAYIKMLTAAGPQQQYYNEIKLISDSNYRVFKKRKASDMRVFIENGIHNSYIRPGHIIYKGSPLGDFDPRLVVQLLEQLTPTNYLLVVQSKHHEDVECDTREKFYDIKYNISNLPIGMTSEMDIPDSLVKNFYMPSPNSYLPENLDVEKPKDPSQVIVADEPTLLTKTDLMEVWFKRDDRFFVPQGSIKLSFDMPEIINSPRMLVSSVLFSWYISDFLKNELDSAVCAGLSFSVNRDDEKLIIGVSGFNDKLSPLMLDILRKIKAHKVDVCLFDMCKKKLVDGYTNMIYNRPYTQATYHASYLNETPHWHYSMVAGELDDMTADDLQDFADHAFDTTYIKMIMAGNFYEQDALDTAKKVEEVLNSKPLPLYKRDEPLVPIFDTGHFVVMSSVPDENCRENAVICQFQCNIGFDPAQNCIRFLLAKILYEPFFDQLRTKEQLGYLVGVNGKRFQQAKGTISFGLQGSFNPAYMTMRINHFLRNYRQVLIDYEDAELDRTIQSITEAWKENHKSIPDEARAHWVHVVGGDYTFNYNRGNVDIMSKVTKQDLIEFWDKHINPATSPCYSRINYQMWASTAYKPTTEEITSFPLAIIAIHGCLRQEGLDCISVSDVAGSIDAVGKSATVDDMLDYIKKLCLDVPDIDKVFEKISDIKSKVRTAIEMALDKTNSIFKYPSARALELESIGMHQLQDGSWVVEDQKAFKSLYPLSNPTVPTRRLVPKYDS